MIQKFLSLVFCFFSIGATAQKLHVDSLISSLPAVSNDTTKARLYKSIAEEAATYDLILAMKYAEQGMHHVEQMKWKKGVAVFNHLVGTIYTDEGNYEKAIQHFEIAYRAHLENGDNYNAAATLNGIGSAYSRQSNADKATDNYFAALALAEKIGNTDLQALCLNNIAIVYFDQNNLDKAMKYDQKALQFYRASQNTTGIANTCVTMANTYLLKKDTVNADKFYSEALTLYTSENDEFGTATTLTNFSMLYGQSQKNLDFKLKAQKIWDRISPAHPISITNLGNLGLMYLDIARSKNRDAFSVTGAKHDVLNIAEKYLDRATTLSKESNSVGNYTFLLGLLSELATEKGDFKKALEYNQQFHHLNDSIYSQESKNKIAAIEGQREVSLRDKEIELNKLALSAQRKQNIGLTLGLVLVAIIGILLYRQNQIRKKTNAELLQLNSQLDKANKVKAKFFAILSHDLRSPLARLINFLYLQREASDLLSPEEATEQEKRITRSAETLLYNMEEILVWSKGQMENFKPSMKQVAVQDMFIRLEQFHSHTDGVSFVFGNTSGLTIDTDENFLFAILQNLTANAVKALNQNPEGKVEWSTLQDGNEVVLSVSDNGPGMEDKLFNSIEVNSEASGLGFHIIRDLANAIQCRITVRSLPGKGTTFYLYFPINYQDRIGVSK